MSNKIRKAQSNNTFTNIAAIDPTVADDSSLGYDVSSQWFNSISKQFFVCEDATVGAAVWNATAGGSGSSGIMISTSNPATILGGTLGTQGVVKFKLLANFSAGGGGGSVSLTVRYGATDMILNLAAWNAGGTSGSADIVLEGILFGNGATNAQAVALWTNDPNIGIGAGGSKQHMVTATGGAAEDSTINKNLQLIFTGANASINSPSFYVFT